MNDCGFHDLPETDKEILQLFYFGEVIADNINE